LGNERRTEGEKQEMKRTAAAADYAAARVPAGHAAAHAKAAKASTAASNDIGISCYENDVPAFIEAEMDRLYGSVYSSLAQFRIYSDGADTSTYIARRGGRIVAIFLFRQRGNCIHVLNETIHVDRNDVICFARYAFASFPDAAVLRFKAVHTDIEDLPFPFQRHNHVEDIVLTLPDTPEAYFDMLGKGTRRNFKRHSRQLDEQVPGARYRVAIGDDIDERSIRSIVELNRARMAGKNKASGIDDLETQRIIRLAKECGLVGTMEIDGRVCAGTIAFRAGDNYYLNVLAHDPRYDQYWLGILCCFRTICECIERGGREFHFLWGEYDYKYMLMGVKRDLDNLLVYRSRKHQIFHGDIALRAAFDGALRALRVRLHAASRRDNLLSRIALRLLGRVRSARGR
jgi:CelD/BcsL family acetyltransferase involved in cellulose biosynthesis